MRKTASIIGLVLALAVVSAAVLGSQASASAKKQSPVSFSVKGGSVPATIGSYLASLQKAVPDPTATSPAHIRSVAKSLAKADGFGAGLVIDIQCTTPPLTCKIIISW